jgi:hypothetical protein
MTNINDLLLLLTDKVDLLKYWYSITMDDAMSTTNRWIALLNTLVVVDLLYLYFLVVATFCVALVIILTLVFDFVRRCMNLRHIKIE